MTEPDKITILAWARLLRAHQQAFGFVEKALKSNDLPPLIWYDILLELEGNIENGLRPQELEKEMLLPQYGISRIINRLEKAGYLERRSCPKDARAQILHITDAGKKIRRQMWPVYGKAIEDSVGAKLTKPELTKLAKTLQKLI